MNKKAKSAISIIVITLLYVIIAINRFGAQSGDYLSFLKPWFDHAKVEGLVSILEHPKCNYNYAYMVVIFLLTKLPINSLYSIKFISVMFDIALALSSMILVYKCVNKEKITYMVLTYFFVLFIPTVSLNSAVWGQCDSIYTTFVIISIINLIDKKYFWSVCFLGIAFMFKLQFIFILPLYALIFCCSKTLRKKIWYFAMIPLVDIIFAIPLLIYTKSFNILIKPFISQLSWYNSYLSMNIPNIYTLLFGGESVNITSSNEMIAKVFILLTMLIYFITLVIFIKRKSFSNPTNENILLVGVWGVLIATYFLPYMHDRYAYLADILSVIWFIIVYSKTDNIKQIFVPLSVQASSLFSYYVYFTCNNYPEFKYAISGLNLFVIVFITVKIFNDICGKIQMDKLIDIKALGESNDR